VIGTLINRPKNSRGVAASDSPWLFSSRGHTVMFSAEVMLGWWDNLGAIYSVGGSWISIEKKSQEFPGRAGSRNFFTGSGSYRYFGFVKLYKQGKNIFKIELLHIFR